MKIRGVDQAAQFTPEQQVSVLVDGDAPSFAASLSNPSASVNSLNQGPNFSWIVTDFSDAGSGVSHQKYRIVDQTSGTVIREWVNLGLDVRAVTPTGLTLSVGRTYRFELAGVDLAGNSSSAVSSIWTAIQIVPTLVFQGVPSSAQTGFAWSSFIVALTDGNGNTMSSTSPVTVTLGAYQDSACTSSAPGVLGGSTQVSSSGVSSFASVTHDTTGVVYLKASAPGYAVACSTGITLSEPPTGIPITITSTSSSVGTDVPVKVLLNTATLITQGRLSNTCSNLRFRSADGTTALAYWLEADCNTSSTTVWVKVPSLPASSSTQILLILDVVGAASQSDGFSVFPVFDDFSASTLNTSRWSASGTVSVASGSVTVQAGKISSVAGVPGTGPMSIEFKMTQLALLGHSLSASFQNGITSTGSDLYNAWNWYEQGSHNSYFYINGSGAWNSSASGVKLGTFRVTTQVSATGINATVAAYPGTSYTNWSRGRTGSPSISTYRKMILSAPYAEPRFSVDWAFARGILSPEPTVSVGPLN